MSEALAKVAISITCSIMAGTIPVVFSYVKPNVIQFQNWKLCQHVTQVSRWSMDHFILNY
jgi:hypothetical protein